ncbi:MAG TPA: nuclear transport factor 2 family protein [Acidimicrobiia bacterium]|nr:nuclear transport factor 2 family protein [Acidimicrobiia bacterium]
MDPEEATRLDVALFRGPVGQHDVPVGDLDAVCRLARIYALGVDRRDEALVQSLFTNDAVVSGSLGRSPATEYVPKLIAGASAYAATMHNITNQYVARATDDASHALDPDDLVVHSYAIALHFHPHAHDEAGDQPDLAMGVEYRDRARRTDDGWLISHRHTAVVWTRRGTLTP